MTPQKFFWILAACLVAFQLFLRYDHWRLDDGRRAEYDALTGRTVVLEKGQRRNLVQWLTGATPRKRSKHAEDDEEYLDDTGADQGVAMSTVADEDKPAKKKLKFDEEADNRWQPDEPDTLVDDKPKRVKRSDRDTPATTSQDSPSKTTVTPDKPLKSEGKPLQKGRRLPKKRWKPPRRMTRWINWLRPLRPGWPM
jgi:hypothetical protein